MDEELRKKNRRLLIALGVFRHTTLPARDNLEIVDL